MHAGSCDGDVRGSIHQTRSGGQLSAMGRATSLPWLARDPGRSIGMPRRTYPEEISTLSVPDIDRRPCLVVACIVLATWL